MLKARLVTNWVSLVLFSDFLFHKGSRWVHNHSQLIHGLHFGYGFPECKIGQFFVIHFGHFYFLKLGLTMAIKYRYNLATSISNNLKRKQRPYAVKKTVVFL